MDTLWTVLLNDYFGRHSIRTYLYRSWLITSILSAFIRFPFMYFFENIRSKIKILVFV